jgi:hypothetical protein
MTENRLDNETAWFAAHAEKPLRDEARQGDVMAGEKAVLDAIAERRGKKAAEKYKADKESGKEQLGIKEAREILGESFYGPEDVQKAFGIDTEKLQIPQIPFTREELEIAKKNGSSLVFRAGSTNESEPLTLQALVKMSRPSMEAKGYNVGALGTAISLAENEQLKTEWKLIETSNVIGGGDFIGLLKYLRKYLRQRNWISKDEENECTDERLAEIRVAYESDGKKGLEELLQLKLVRNHVRSITETCYDNFLEILSRERNKKQENDEQWTRTPRIERGIAMLARISHFWDRRGIMCDSAPITDSRGAYTPPTIHLTK